MPESQVVVGLTTDIAKSFVGKNTLATDQLPGLIQEIHKTLAALEKGEVPEPKREPFVPIRRSVKKDQIICLECGKGHKMLKRHLGAAHNLTVDEYRLRWQLPSDYPVVAPDYAEVRSKMAKKIGLGKKTGRRGKRRR